MSRLEFISAGAGSGKTHTLTTTLSQLLQQGQVQPAGVIATTFTKKAATELRERVRLRLLEERQFRLASAMGQAHIGTVHGVCGELLQRFAFEAGLAPQLQVIDEAQAETLLLQSIDAARSGPQLAELIALAARLGIEQWPEELRKLLNQARANDIDANSLRSFASRNADDLLSHFPPAITADLSAALKAAIEQTLRCLEPQVPADGRKNSLAYIKTLRDCLRSLQRGTLPWSDWVRLIGELPEKALQQDAEAVQDVARRFAEHPQLHADIRQWLETLFGLAADVLVHYQQRKRELGVLDFTDQEHLTLQLLDHPLVKATLRDELDLLLVDEFQDTSPIQLALFMKLAGLARYTYWVGDIKQAIYGFRGSDTALMQGVLVALPALGGSGSRLEYSYRSVPQLVSLVNCAFRSAFSATQAAGDVELQPRRETLSDQPAFANWCLQGRNIGLRAAALAAGVSRLLQAGRQVFDKQDGCLRQLMAGDIAILSRSNEGVDKIATALAEAGIPVATSRCGLLATPEATLALACLRRLHDATDTIATAEILSLADGLPPESWLADRLQHMQQGKDRHNWMEEGSPPHPILGKLAGLRDQLSLLAPMEALQMVIVGCGLPQRVIRWQQEPERARLRLANLEALLALAGQYEDSCRNNGDPATIAGLILWLRQIAEQGKDEQATPAVDAVRVLTHHSAKGLEWPVVILTDLEKPARSRLWDITATSGGEFDAHQPLRQRYIRYWPWPFGGRSKNIDVSDRIDLTPVARQFQQVADEEAIRLLYVSMTRARDMLILAHNATAGSSDWLDLLQADWLLKTSADSSQLTLPDKQTIACEHWELEAASAAPIGRQAGSPLYCFPVSTGASRLPLVFNPSAAESGHATIAQQTAIGRRLDVAGDVDWGVLGSAVHACLALEFCSAGKPLQVFEIERILQQFGLPDTLVPQALLEQIQAFRAWLAARWPGLRPMAEVPVCAVLPSQQYLNGRIDLLLETADGYILIDHKSAPLAANQWQGLASRHAGQLQAYATALELATGRTVLERWLYLPVAGGAARL